MKEIKPFALSLKGGAVLGMGGIGVIRFLQENNITPTVVAGSSSGAMIAALYSMGLTSEEMIGELSQLRFINFLSLSSIFRNGAFVHPGKYRKIIQNFRGDKNFEELKIPLVVFATNPVKGERVFIEKGSIVDALLASSGYPPVFPTAYLPGYHNQALIDGDFTSGYSTNKLKSMGAEKVIGISFKNEITSRQMRAGLFARTMLVQRLYSELIDKQNDLVETPDVEIEYSVGHAGRFNLKDIGHIAHNAYLQTLKQKDQIMKVLSE